MLQRKDLHAYQLKAIDFVTNTPKSALFLDLGLGKTTTALTAISDLLDAHMVNKVLVIAPLRVANSVWKQEASRWEHLNHLSFAICTGSEKSRISALELNADVTVINRENICWLTDYVKRGWDWGMVVVDESSSFKSHSSKRFKSLKKINDLIPRMIELTATPSPNGLLGLWSQVYLLDNGARLGKTITSFRAKYFDVDYSGFNFKPKPKSHDEIQNLIKDIAISMSAEDYLKMPDRVNITVTCGLSTKANADYKNFERNLLLELQDKEIEAINAAVLAGKLLQYCLAEDTQVLTSIGFVSIQEVTCDHLVFDGYDFVACEGVSFNGEFEVIEVDGVFMTPDHLILTESGFIQAKEFVNEQ